MTLDVRIGQAQLVCEDGHFMVHVAQCPDSETDICKPVLTAWAKESYRSGSTAFWQFFRTGQLKSIYMDMREYHDTNDLDVASLLPFLDRIQSIDSSIFNAEADKDRLLWLKHWSQVAVDLYGDHAAISFS